MLSLLLALGVLADGTLRVPVAPAETLSVEVHGSGPPVVMVPWLFGSAYAFRKVVPSLVAHGRRVIVIEPLGAGASSRPATADYSLAAQAERVGAVLDSLGVRGAVVVSHSVATGVMLRLALRRPDLVGAVVSLEGGPTETAATAGFRRAMALAPLLRLAGGGLVRSRIRSGLREASADDAWVTDEVVERYTAGATASLGATLRAYRRLAEAREPAPLAPRLGQLRCPLILLLGATPHRGGPPDAEIRLLHRSVPAFEIVRVPDAGHYIHEEQPEAVVAAVQRAMAALVARGP